LEQQIVQIWQSVLHVEQVGVQDNFFELGGNSLLMSEVLQRFLACDTQNTGKLQRELSLVTLFRYPTIQSLAEVLSSGQMPEGEANAEGLARAQNRQRHAQRRMQRVR
jgi:polyketide synthase PksJ